MNTEMIDIYGSIRRFPLSIRSSSPTVNDFIKFFQRPGSESGTWLTGSGEQGLRDDKVSVTTTSWTVKELQGDVPPPSQGSAGSGSAHPEASRVQNLWVLGEMHLNAAVVADGHRQLLQGRVPAVRTEGLVHVAGRPGNQTEPWLTGRTRRAVPMGSD